MKVLMTGMTTSHTGDLQFMGIFNSTEAIYQCLLKLGHEVEWRKATFAEKVTDYDVVIVGQAPVASLGTRTRSAQALKVIAECEDAGVPCYYLLDDAKLWDIAAGLRRCFKNGPDMFEKRLREMGSKPELLDQVRGIRETTYRIITDMAAGKWHKTIAAAFPWGDDDKFVLGVQLKPEDLLRFDPSGMVPKQQFTQGPREQKWVLAALGDHRGYVEKLGLKWSVDFYGNKHNKDPRVPEQEIVQLYSKYWGVLGQKYRSAGGGWWRNRYNYASQAGAILYCDPDEVRPMGARDNPYLLPPDLEQYNSSFLARIARDQAEFLKKHTWSEEQALEFVRKLLADPA